MINVKNVAKWLSGIDSDCASRIEFAETMVLFDKIRKTSNINTELTASDMINADTDVITARIKILLNRVLSSEDLAADAWWKNSEHDEFYWDGEIVVDEKFILPEQYKLFFSRNNEASTFDEINWLLEKMVVRINELNEETSYFIKQQILDGESSGVVESGDYMLHWKFKGGIYLNAMPLTLGDLTKETREMIAVKLTGVI